MNEGAGRSVWAAQSSVAPDLREVYGGLDWHRAAACRDADVGFFPTEFNGAPKMESLLPSSALLAPLLVCEGCTVRRECLEAGLTPTPVVYVLETGPSRYPKTEKETICWIPSEGIWGGTTRWDRMQVDGLPPAEAADQLESTLEARLNERIAAWSDNISDHPRRRTSRFGRLVVSMLAARAVTATRPRPAACERTASWHRATDSALDQ